LDKGLTKGNSPKQNRGIIRREKRKEKHEIRASLETMKMELGKKPFNIWTTNPDEPIDFLVVDFHFKNKITPREFREILLEKLGDLF
jgi:hypothetical protein